MTILAVVVVNRSGQENNILAQKSRVNVVGALAELRFFYDCGN